MEKLAKTAESLVVTALGMFLLIASLNIRNNPIEYPGWAGVLAQPKFLPVLMSAGICILGLVLFIKQFRGTDKSATLEKHEVIRLSCTTGIVASYLISVYFFKFTIPTVIYSFVAIFYLNWGNRKIKFMVLTAILAIILGLVGLPMLINLRLP